MRSAAILLSLFVLLTFPAGSQPPGTPDGGDADSTAAGAMAKGPVAGTGQSKPVAQGVVAGRVFLADSHTPARGARILLMPAAELVGGNATPPNTQQMAVTALDGTFRVEHVAEGSYVVWALAAGYLSPIDGMDIHVDSADLDTKAMGKKILENSPVVEVRGSQTAHTEIELERGAALAGRVIYSDGAPAAQLEVGFQKADGKDAPKDDHADQVVDAGSLLRSLLLQQRNYTDDQGRFRIAGLAPGKYRLAVVQNLMGTMNFEDAFADLFSSFNPLGTPNGSLTVYSGSTLHRRDAKTWDLKAGDEVNEIEIVLPLNGLHTVRGIAAGTEGAPANFGVAELTDVSDRAMTFRGTITAEGEVRFAGIPEGAYQLKISKAGVFDGIAPGDEVSANMMEGDPQRFKQRRAFAEVTVPVMVGTHDIDNLSVTLADVPVPEAKTPPGAPVEEPHIDVQAR